MKLEALQPIKLECNKVKKASIFTRVYDQGKWCGVCQLEFIFDDRTLNKKTFIGNDEVPLTWKALYKLGYMPNCR